MRHSRLFVLYSRSTRLSWLWMQSLGMLPTLTHPSSSSQVLWGKRQWWAQEEIGGQGIGWNYKKKIEDRLEKKKKELHTSKEKLFKPIETVCLAMVRKMYPWKNILKSIMTFSHKLAGLLNKPCGKLWCLIIILNFLYDVGIFIPLICCGLFSLRVWVP